MIYWVIRLGNIFTANRVKVFQHPFWIAHDETVLPQVKMFQCKNKGYTICTQPGDSEMSQVSATAFKFCTWKPGGLSWCCCKAREGAPTLFFNHLCESVGIQSPKEKAAPGVQADEGRRQTASKAHEEQEAMPTKGELDSWLLIYPARGLLFLHPIPVWRGGFLSRLVRVSKTQRPLPPGN